MGAQMLILIEEIRSTLLHLYFLLLNTFQYFTYIDLAIEQVLVLKINFSV